MDLREYELVKFDLAEIIRAARRVDQDPRWQDLMVRLAEDRFTVVVAGRFSRGKSSLMNAVFGFDSLPVGIVPLTSVITSVSYGTNERIRIEYRDGRLRGEAPLAELASYVTERGNPGNVKRIRSVEIQLPAEILRRGFFFVDTPGLGSLILENTESTESFLPEIDVLVLVTGFESPLSEDEVSFLRSAAPLVRSIFVVVNKQDTVTPGERDEVATFILDKLKTILSETSFRLFSISAREGLTAKRASNLAAIRASGLEQFERELVELLSSQRANLFLSAMCDRIRGLLRSRPEAARVEALRVRLDATPPLAVAPVPRAPRAHPCTICGAVTKSQFEFMSHFQFELLERESTCEEFARKGGFCAAHTWLYEQLASPRGLCAVYPRMLAQVAEGLRSRAVRHIRCIACEMQRKAEDNAMASAVGAPDRTAFCVPHLLRVSERIEDRGARERLFSAMAGSLERMAEDLQRFAMKQDALRRDLVTEEERVAPLLALQLLVGERSFRR